MTHRLMLEAREHDENCMLTLTIRKECYEGSWHPPLCRGTFHGDNVLVREAQDFLKRLRVAGLERGKSRSFRYYVVGEYGDDNGRAHYHLALFGFANLGIFARCWPYGRVQLDELNWKTAAYICGYMAEKGSDDYVARVRGRNPEFARMSLKPGLGSIAADRIGMALGESDEALQALDDVPSVLNSDGRSWPLGRYLQGRVRQMVGFGARVPEARKRASAGRVLSQVLDSGSSSAFVERREARRKHDAVKARQRARSFSKLFKGKLRETD